MDCRYDLGEDVYVLIKAPQLTIHIRKHFVRHGEWSLHPTKIGLRSDPESLRMERTEKDHTLFEDRESELRTMDNKVTGED